MLSPFMLNQALGRHEREHAIDDFGANRPGGSTFLGRAARIHLGPQAVNDEPDVPARAALPLRFLNASLCTKVRRPRHGQQIVVEIAGSGADWPPSLVRCAARNRASKPSCGYQKWEKSNGHLQG